MELALWTYEGPPHVGAIRIAASMRDVHLVLHAPQGDTYADLLFTMIERENRRPPVTWTTFQARDLGSSTAEMVINTLEGVCERVIVHLHQREPRGDPVCRQRSCHRTYAAGQSVTEIDPGLPLRPGHLNGDRDRVNIAVRRRVGGRP